MHYCANDKALCPSGTTWLLLMMMGCTRYEEMVITYPVAYWGLFIFQAFDAINYLVKVNRTFAFSLSIDIIARLLRCSPPITRILFNELELRKVPLTSCCTIANSQKHSQCDGIIWECRFVFPFNNHLNNSIGVYMFVLAEEFTTL